MNDREKLLELIAKAKDICANDYSDHTEDEYIADMLLDNGVTVQQWVPLAERYPDLVPCNAGTAYSEAVIVWTTGKKAMIAVWDGTDFLCAADYWDAEGETITHWMPLPEPPKGESE